MPYRFPGGGAEVVDVLPPVENQGVDDQFWLEAEETLHRVEEYETGGMPGSLIKTPVVDADIVATNQAGDTDIEYLGAVTVDPDITDGVWKFFWDATPGSILSGSNNPLDRTKVLLDTGVFTNWGLLPSWFRNADTVHTIGDPASGFGDFNYNIGDLSEVNEDAVLGVIEANPALRAAIGEANTIVLWGAIENLYRITGYVAEVPAGKTKRYTELFRGAEVVDELPPVEDQSIDDQFWLENDETLYRVGVVESGGTPRSLVKTPLVDADFVETSGPNDVDYLGAIMVDPAALVGTWKFFWDATPGNSLSGPAGGNPTDRTKVLLSDGTFSNWGLVAAWFLDIDTLYTIGDPLSGAGDFNYDIGELAEADEAIVMDTIEANQDLRDAIGTPGTLVVWGAVENLYKITGYETGVPGSTVNQYVELSGGAKIVPELPPVEEQSIGDQFWLEEEETLHRVGEQEIGGVVGSIEKTPLITADFNAGLAFLGTPIVWVGYVTVLPAVQVGTLVLFWDGTEGAVLTDAIGFTGVGSVIKGLTPEGGVFTLTFQSDYFDETYVGGAQWFGDPLHSDIDFIELGDEATDTEAEIIAILDADGEASTNVNDPTWLSLYFDSVDLNVYRLTGHTSTVLGGTANKYVELSGGGGGGPVTEVLTTRITRTTFHGSLDTNDAGDFEDVPGMIAAPANWTYAMINFGADSDGEAGSAHRATIDKAEFDVWLYSNAGDSPLDTNGRHFRDFPSNAPASVNAYGRDVFIGKDIDDKFIFATATVARNLFQLVVTFVLEEDVTVVSTGVEGWISPQDEYGEDSIGKYLIDEGQLKQVERTYEAGHIKTVGALGEPGDWYDIPPDDEGGGPGQHWRGWHTRGNQVTNPDPVLGDFFGDRLYGSFESFHDGTGAGTGWREYNPFRGNNYWAGSITIGVDVVDIISNGFYNVDSIVHAFNATEQAGEVFAIPSAERIVISKAVVDSEPAHVRIEPRVWVQPLAVRASPYAMWYGEGQVSKYPDPSARVFIGHRYYRLTFASNHPNKYWNGGHAMGARILDAVDSPNYDLITRDALVELRGDKKVLELDYGRYRVKLRAWGNGFVLSSFGIFIYTVLEGADSQFFFAQSGYNLSLNDPLGSVSEEDARVIEFNETFEVAAPTQYTFILAGEALNDVELVAINEVLSFYLEIERLN